MTSPRFAVRRLLPFLLVLASPLCAPAATEDELRKKFVAASEQTAAENYPGAIELYNQILAERPESGDALVRRAAARVQLGDFSSARADLAQAFRANPKNPAAFLVRGELKLRSGDLPGALEDFDRGIALAPTEAINHAFRGETLFRLTRLNDALVDFDRALELSPNFPDALQFRGQVHEAKGNLSLASADYSQAIRLQPQNPQRHFQRALFRFRSRDWDGAIADARRAAERLKGSDLLEARRMVGYAQFGKGDNAAAAATLGEEVSRGIDESSVYALLIRHLALTRMGSSAAPELAAAVGKLSGKAWPVALAKFLLGTLGEDELEAIAAGASAEPERSERACEMHFYIGMVRLQAGDKATARLRLRSAVATNQTGFSEHSLARAFVSGLEPAAPPASAPGSGGPDPAVLRQAEEGGPDAQWQLAEHYRRQTVPAPDAAKLRKEWWSRAVAGGSAAAQLALAKAFLDGTDGYAKDDRRAVRLLESAAKTGNAEAQWRLGERYFSGPANFRRDDRAAQFLQQAVQSGERRAEASYGVLLFRGRGIAADPKAAVKHLGAAEKRGDLNARRFLFELWKDGEIRLQTPDMLERVLDYGVQAGDPIAMLRLGVKRYKGEGVALDEKKGLSLLKEASNHGNREASRMVREHYARRLEEQGALDKNGAAYADALRDFRWAVFTDGRNGTREDRLEAARVITAFAGPTSPDMKERLKLIVPNDVAGAIALIRVYRSEGGTNAEALRWLETMDRHIAGWKTQRAYRDPLSGVNDYEKDIQRIVGERSTGKR